MTGATLYSITHRDSGREYVGVTTQLVQSRWRFHISRAGKPVDHDANTGMPIVRALRDHGCEAFDFRVIATLPTAEEGLIAERIAIATRQPAFNACSGPTGDHERSPETRAKVADSNRRAWADGRRSRRFSPETRAKMSAAHRGHQHSSETRALIGEANRRRVVTEESRAKMSAARRGVKHGPMSPETKAKIAASARARAAARKAQG